MKKDNYFEKLIELIEGRDVSENNEFHTLSKIKSKGDFERLQYFVFGFLKSELGKFYLDYKKVEEVNIDKIEDIKKDSEILSIIPIPKGVKQFNSSLMISGIVNKVEQLNKKEIKENRENVIKNLNNLINFSYSVMSVMDKQIIKDHKTIKEKRNQQANKKILEKYGKAFKKHFLKSWAGMLICNKGLLSKKMEYEFQLNSSNNSLKDIFEKEFNWVCFNFSDPGNDQDTYQDNPLPEKEEIEKMIKKGLKENKQEDSEGIRIFLEEESYLIFIKPNQVKYWIESEAYKDSLDENKLIAESIVIV